MGILNFLFRKKVKMPKSVQISDIDIDYHTPQYYRLLETQPNISEIWGRDYDFPKYDDSFTTKENYKLRELLLLVWWGKTKNGRKSTATIPKYFFNDYNLNAEKITAAFKTEGLIVDVDNKILLTQKGKDVYSKYKALWEIHSVKHYPTNLDIDFPKWNKEKFELEFYQMELKYYKSHASYCKKMINFFNSFSAPASHQGIHNEINYYISEDNRDFTKVNDYQEKIAILKEKITINETMCNH